MPTIYQVDAFTSRVFGGNPAAVVPFDVWPDDALLQSIATENNLAETAFLVPDGEDWQLRWFTPATEVPLCGHATLASAHVVLRHIKQGTSAVSFHTRQSGTLHVTEQADGRLAMDFPVINPVSGPDIEPFTAALGLAPQRLLTGMVSPVDPIHLAVFAQESDVANMQPDFGKLKQIPCFGVIATAPGDKVDFVSRFFAPAVGIDEDPVTGGAHCILTPYWASQLGKQNMEARQISARGGELNCQLDGERVTLTGHAVDYMRGEINIG